ncbi:MAG: ATP-dependent DNA helicase RecG [Bacteroidales bacterium]|nr:ATP-dependent DNA helicase RecG [Bacteroidales bacterium]
MNENLLSTQIEYLKGVGPKRGELLRNELGIYTWEDLLTFYPFRYVDRTKFHKINEIESDMAFVQIKGKVTHVEMIGQRRARRFIATFKDDTGSIELVWFQGIKWIKDKLIPNREYVIFGKPTIFNRKFNIPHPEIDPVDEYKPTENVFQPIYSSGEKLKSRGLNSKGISKLIKTLLSEVQGHIPETLALPVLEKTKLLAREEAIINIHFPANQDMLKRAQARLKFEELFFIQLRLVKHKLVRSNLHKGIVFPVAGHYLEGFYKHNLPFELTGAQKRVMREIRRDLAMGVQMNRLLQGDVGSGKTLVALMAMLIALGNNFQSCIMAPTEILANQHYETLARMLKGMDIRIRLLTGSTKSNERREIHEELQSGSNQILIGTHALIEESVRFKNLGLVVIDEQHRFGVAQRARMWKKNTVPPHVLVMTATPIPRTMAMTVYGDFDYSVIDELPPGRKPVKTTHATDAHRLRVFGFLKREIAKGRQVYIVYPLIQESEKLDLKDLMDGYESIVREFPLPKYAISIVHGQMKPADKDYEMQRFIRNETQIMVATTVIEVGVDIPNASIMVIENAERFGLSQLHQLRGRVGRGADQSYCILMTGDKIGNEARERIKTMVETSDGFKIAEKDLRLRGPGDVIGTRQSGGLTLKQADLIQDAKILEYARNMAFDVLNDDLELKKSENYPMKKQLLKMSTESIDWGVIT